MECILSQFKTRGQQVSHRACDAYALKSTEGEPDYGKANGAEITTAQINPLAERARQAPDELSFDA
jgi:hypothetical protein